MKSGHGLRNVVLAVTVVIVVAVVSYGVFPYAVSANIKDLKPDSTVYLYGNVSSRISLLTFSGFELNQGNKSVMVFWNGTLPAVGENVLVHGTVSQKNIFGVEYVQASSVSQWYF